MKCHYFKFEYYLHKDGKYKNGEQRYICNLCGTKKATNYRKTKTGKQSIKNSINKYVSENPERRYAWEKAPNIVKKPCIVCGEYNVHRHHPDILKPFEVIMLCPLHHKAAHNVL